MEEKKTKPDDITKLLSDIKTELQNLNEQIKKLRDFIKIFH